MIENNASLENLLKRIEGNIEFIELIKPIDTSLKEKALIEAISNIGECLTFIRDSDEIRFESIKNLKSKDTNFPGEAYRGFIYCRNYFSHEFLYEKYDENKDSKNTFSQNEKYIELNILSFKEELLKIEKKPPLLLPRAHKITMSENKENPYNAMDYLICLYHHSLELNEILTNLNLETGEDIKKILSSENMKDRIACEALKNSVKNLGQILKDLSSFINKNNHEKSEFKELRRSTIGEMPFDFECDTGAFISCYSSDVRVGLAHNTSMNPQPEKLHESILGARLIAKRFCIPMIKKIENSIKIEKKPKNIKFLLLKRNQKI